MIHSNANHKSCFCKQILKQGLTWLYAERGMSMCTHARTHARIQPQLFCYFPLQHLVLISFLMRLWLRPIRANYQRRSGVGCMPTMTPVPRETPGWKRPQHFSFCTSFQSKKIEHHAGSCKLYSALQYMKAQQRRTIYSNTLGHSICIDQLQMDDRGNTEWGPPILPLKEN